jgi:cytokinin riboside 5'-monophosphate phosphoribohydrolase
MAKTICVYSSSSDAVDQKYFAVARQLGERMAKDHYSLIYGGAAIGLMGEVARAVQGNGCHVTGVIPKYLNRDHITFKDADQLIVTDTMRERKAIMEKRADAFIGLPGGFGTLEEILEVMTLKQLQYHDKPIVIINCHGFFQYLIDLFDHLYREDFAKEMYRKLYFITDTVDEAMNYIQTYMPPELPKKWY